MTSPARRKKGTAMRVKEVVPLMRFWAMICESNMSRWSMSPTAAPRRAKEMGMPMIMQPTRAPRKMRMVMVSVLG